MSDAGTEAVLSEYESAIDQLQRALAGVRSLGSMLDEGAAEWMLQSMREIAEVASGAATMICAEALHLEASKQFSVDYVRRAG